MADTATFSTEISDAFREHGQGCALCSLWAREEASVTEELKREGEQEDGVTMKRILKASGFCNRHTHAVHKTGSTADAAKGLGCPACARAVVRKFADGLAPILTNLQTARGRPDPGRGKGEEALAATIRQLEDIISGDAMCPVCQGLLESDMGRIATLLRMLDGKEFAELYGKSGAMCMPHFVSAMKQTLGAPLKHVEGVWNLLMRTEITNLELIGRLLNQRMKKYSWDYRNEGLSQEEANAQRTAMLAIAGVEGLYCRPRKTSLRPAR
jgi:hypothetical protein